MEQIYSRLHHLMTLFSAGESLHKYVASGERNRVANKKHFRSAAKRETLLPSSTQTTNKGGKRTNDNRIAFIMIYNEKENPKIGWNLLQSPQNIK